MAKGEGKGKFIDAIAENFMRAVCCLVILAISGPIMVIVGIVYLVNSATDSRKKLVDQYNDFVDACESA